MRRRVRKASPTGDMVSTTCRFARHCDTKKPHSAAELSAAAAFFARARTASMIIITSSFGKRFGTSPVLRILLTSSCGTGRAVQG